MANKEKFIGESPLLGQPHKKVSFRLRPNSVGTQHIQDGSVTPIKLSSDTISAFVELLLQDVTFIEALKELVPAVRIHIVDSLPIASEEYLNHFVLVRKSDSGADKFDEWLCVEVDPESTVYRYDWEYVGTREIDLSDYTTHEELEEAMNTALEDYATKQWVRDQHYAVLGDSEGSATTVDPDPQYDNCFYIEVGNSGPDMYYLSGDVTYQQILAAIQQKKACLMLVNHSFLGRMIAVHSGIDPYEGKLFFTAVWDNNAYLFTIDIDDSVTYSAKGLVDSQELTNMDLVSVNDLVTINGHSLTGGEAIVIDGSGTFEQVKSDWNELDPTKASFIENKPDLSNISDLFVVNIIEEQPDPQSQDIVYTFDKSFSEIKNASSRKLVIVRHNSSIYGENDTYILSQITQEQGESTEYAIFYSITNNQIKKVILSENVIRPSEDPIKSVVFRQDKYVNSIETIKIDNQTIQPVNKTVNIDLSSYATESWVTQQLSNLPVTDSVAIVDISLPIMEEGFVIADTSALIDTGRTPIFLKYTYDSGDAYTTDIQRTLYPVIYHELVEDEFGSQWIRIKALDTENLIIYGITVNVSDGSTQHNNTEYLLSNVPGYVRTQNGYLGGVPTAAPPTATIEEGEEKWILDQVATVGFVQSWVSTHGGGGSGGEGGVTPEYLAQYLIEHNYQQFFVVNISGDNTSSLTTTTSLAEIRAAYNKNNYIVANYRNEQYIPLVRMGAPGNNDFAEFSVVTRQDDEDQERVNLTTLKITEKNNNRQILYRKQYLIQYYEVTQEITQVQDDITTLQNKITALENQLAALPAYNYDSSTQTLNITQSNGNG